MTDIRYWVGLSVIPEVGPLMSTKLLAELGSPENIFAPALRGFIRKSHRRPAAAVSEAEGRVCGLLTREPKYIDLSFEGEQVTGKYNTQSASFPGAKRCCTAVRRKKILSFMR